MTSFNPFQNKGLAYDDSNTDVLLVWKGRKVIAVLSIQPDGTVKGQFNGKEGPSERAFGDLEKAKAAVCHFASRSPSGNKPYKSRRSEGWISQNAIKKQQKQARQEALAKVQRKVADRRP